MEKWVVKGESPNPQPADQESPSKPLLDASPPRNQHQCKFFLRNACNKGTDCSHMKGPPEGGRTPPTGTLNMQGMKVAKTKEKRDGESMYP
eukprot:4043320-Heterocapsa_arctica.AAC.1